MTPVEALVTALRFVPEPVVIRRGTSAGAAPEGVIWGTPEPGSYTEEQRAGTVLAALPGNWRLVDMDALVERVAQGFSEGDAIHPGVSWGIKADWSKNYYRDEARRLLGIEP